MNFVLSLLLVINVQSVAGEPTNTDFPRQLALLSESIQGGAYYGFSDSRSYLMAISLGPHLIIKEFPRNSKNYGDGALTYYSLISAKSTVDEITAEFTSVTADSKGNWRFEHFNPRRISIRFHLNYRSVEGEFAESPDLIGVVMFGDENSKVQDTVKLSRTFRYQLAAMMDRPKCTAEVEELSDLLCSTVKSFSFDVCTLTVMGKNNPRVLKAQELKNSYAGLNVLTAPYADGSAECGARNAK